MRSRRRRNVSCPNERMHGVDTHDHLRSTPTVCGRGRHGFVPLFGVALRATRPGMSGQPHGRHLHRRPERVSHGDCYEWLHGPDVVRRHAARGGVLVHLLEYVHAGREGVHLRWRGDVHAGRQRMLRLRCGCPMPLIAPKLHRPGRDGRLHLQHGRSLPDLGKRVRERIGACELCDGRARLHLRSHVANMPQRILHQRLLR